MLEIAKEKFKTLKEAQEAMKALEEYQALNDDEKVGFEKAVAWLYNEMKDHVEYLRKRNKCAIDEIHNLNNEIFRYESLFAGCTYSPFSGTKKRKVKSNNKSDYDMPDMDDEEYEKYVDDSYDEEEPSYREDFDE